MCAPGAVIGGLNTRRGTITDSEVREEEFTAIAEVALNDMFGYSSHLRGVTQGKGEFSMEYKVRSRVSSPRAARAERHRRTTCRCSRACRRSSRRRTARRSRRPKSRRATPTRRAVP